MKVGDLVMSKVGFGVGIIIDSYDTPKGLWVVYFPHLEMDDDLCHIMNLEVINEI